MVEGVHTAFLVSAAAPYRFTIPLPSWIGVVDQNVGWSIESFKLLPRAVALKRVDCHAVMSNELFTVRIKAYNGSQDVRLGRVAVAMELLDAGDVVLEQWTSDVMHDVWPRQWGQVVVHLPPRWREAEKIQGRMVGVREADDQQWGEWDAPDLSESGMPDGDIEDPVGDDDDDDEVAGADDSDDGSPTPDNGATPHGDPMGGDDDDGDASDGDDSGSILFPWLPLDDGEGDADDAEPPDGDVNDVMPDDPPFDPEIDVMPEDDEPADIDEP
jgi:hypothetical protein